MLATIGAVPLTGRRNADRVRGRRRTCARHNSGDERQTRVRTAVGGQAARSRSTPSVQRNPRGDAFGLAAGDLLDGAMPPEVGLLRYAVSLRSAARPTPRSAAPGSARSVGDRARAATSRTRCSCSRWTPSIRDSTCAPACSRRASACPKTRRPAAPALPSRGYLAARDPRHDGTLQWIVEQGFEMGRPSILEVEADKKGGRITAARVGGQTVVVCEGTMEL